MKYDICWLLENLSSKYVFDLNLTRRKFILQEGLIKFMKYLAEFFLKWDLFQTEFVQKIKTQIYCLTIFS